MSGSTIAVLGAGGTMGRGIARNLRGAGIAVRAWNRTPGRLESVVGDGATAHESPAEAARGADAVLTILSDGDAVLSVMERVDAGEGAVWIQMSTIGVEATDRCIELAAQRRLTFVDAPVLGTKKPAEEGELVVLASGPDAALDRLAPAFEAIGKRTLRLGEAGTTSRLKVALNAWIVTVVEGAAESLALAEALGVDPSLLLETLSGGPLDLPYLQTKGRMMIEHDFPPSFRLELAAKDADLAVSAARSASIELPMVEAIAAQLQRAAREHGDDDLSAAFLAVSPAAARA